MPAPAVADFETIAPVPCPCGFSRRAFAGLPASPVTLHRVDISLDAKVHFHKRLTEVYYVLDCDAGAALELDGERVPVRPGIAVLIPPYTPHRAVGKMRVLVLSHPQFDPADEWATETERAENVAS
ncbi:MAG TPA: cupin domain-containing protein [Gemmataceae bacterium]|jgi:mannose-6-phosphate isomerase-like protein (cupin superfamily)